MEEKSESDVFKAKPSTEALLKDVPDTKTPMQKIKESLTLRYTLTEIPPIPICTFVALQHVLVSLASALTMSSVISDSLCADLGHPIRARLFASTLCMQGICTVAQTLIGVRLPVFQGPSSSFLVPLIALSRNPGWICPQSEPTAADHNQYTSLNSTTTNHTMAATLTQPASLSLEDKLQQLSGSLMVSSLLEVVVGGLGLMRHILRYIGPLTVAPTIALIGLALFQLPVSYARFNPAITLGSAVLVIVFSLYMSKIQVPLPGCSKGRNRTYMPIFQLLPILLAMMVMWMLCGVLTMTGVFPDDPSHPSYYARTDAKLSIVTNTPWFKITYPGQFGPPSINVAATIGFLAAIMASMIESVGDYYAAAKCCQVMPPPDHAMSRGILVEGVGSFLSGTIGTAHATTSYSGNIAMLSLTQTASRSVLVLAGCILIVLSLVGKVGAALATVPPPILGGILLLILGLLSSIGISTLKYVDMTSNRNLLIIGTALMAGLSVPSFVEQHDHMLDTGNENADQIIRVVLGTPMFLGGLIAFILDNTVPGTDEERGIIGWKQSHSTSTGNDTTQNGDLLKPKPDTDSEEDHLGDERSSAIQGCLTEEEVYSFQILKGRLSSSLWSYIPFLPPNIVPPNKEQMDDV